MQLRLPSIFSVECVESQLNQEGVSPPTRRGTSAPPWPSLYLATTWTESRSLFEEAWGGRSVCLPKMWPRPLSCWLAPNGSHSVQPWDTDIGVHACLGLFAGMHVGEWDSCFLEVSLGEALSPFVTSQNPQNCKLGISLSSDLLHHLEMLPQVRILGWTVRPDLAEVLPPFVTSQNPQNCKL